MKHFQKIGATILVALLLLLQIQTIGQEPLFVHASREFDTRNYAKAIPLFDQALAEGKLTANQQRQAKINMAYAYFQLGDNTKAEKLYEEIINEAPLKGFMISHYLNYAKILANNGKTTQSQEILRLYQVAKSEDEKGINNGRVSTTKKISYRLDNLAFNTPESEFSPAYYRDGLVFLAGKSSVSDEKIQKGFLDLYYVPNHVDIKATGDASKTTTKNNTASNTNKRPLGDDYYTRHTANDSHTAGVYESYGINNSNSNSNTVGPQTNGKPGKPVPFSKTLNTPYHEGPATFSKDGTKVIFTRNNFNGGKKGESVENNIKLKLYSSQWGKNDWENIQELPFNSDEYSTAHPTLSRNGQLLYFVSDMPGGVGGKDLYVSRLEGSQWSTPVSLGREINTKNDEVFPFADDSGNLYFSTAGRRNGLGGLDIYYAILSSDGTKVIDILPLDAPINSKADDFGIITDATRNTGYLSSNREGDDNIYRFTRESSMYDCRDLTLRVFNEETMQPIDSARVAVRTRGSSEVLKEIFTDEYGRIHICLATDNDFVFNITKLNLLPNTIGFSTKNLTDDRPTRLEVILTQPSMIIDTTAVAIETSIPTQPDDKPTTKPAIQKTTPKSDGWDNSPNSIKATMQLIGVARTPGTGEPIPGALVELRNECTGKIVKTTLSNDKGYYEFNNIRNINNCGYYFKVSKEKYSIGVVKIKKPEATKKAKVISTDITLFKEGDKVGLDNVNFTNTQTSLNPIAVRELDRVLATMQRYPSLKIEILSHTDSRGEAEANRAISQKRAQSVVDHLVKKGIARTRLKAVGMGESNPLNECKDGVECTDSEYQRNRRTEFKVVSIN
jgi:outer membrane protein OmpA-like peptidoglycan-associated protein